MRGSEAGVQLYPVSLPRLRGEALYCSILGKLYSNFNEFDCIAWCNEVQHLRSVPYVTRGICWFQGNGQVT